MRQPATASSQSTSLRRSVDAATLPTPGPPLAELGFDDRYRRFHLPPEALEDHERRFELWDRPTRTALEVREPTSPYHERPSQMLAALAERIAAVRGHPIRCFGTMDLTLPGADGKPARIMQADQSLYLHPQRANIVGPSAMVIGEHHHPDVVLEVDRSTDVRRHKLALYEAWKFPEVWVDVPDEAPRPRKARGAIIYLLEDGTFREADESRAFPGWRASEIHQALNEDTLSEHTAAILERVGTALGSREGTGPDDDPLLRSQRRQARAETLANERAQRATLVRHILTARDINVAADFPRHDPAFVQADPKALAEAAMRCADKADFLARLRRVEATPLLQSAATASDWTK